MRYFTFLIFSFLFGTYSYAAPVSKNAARVKAESFLKEKGISLNKGVSLAKSAYNGSESQEMAAYYVFNASEGNGFVIVSGDDRTDAILGYSETGTFDADNLPANLSNWLEGYAKQIALLSGADSARYKVSRASDASYAAIEPMVETKWGQDYPYNDLCPEYQGFKCVTGCVATAIAQIMYYHQWPQDYTEPISGYTSSSCGITLDDLASVKFDWDSMELDPDTENSAVATLMRYVGQAVEMDYSLSASGATADDAARSLVESFGYDCNLKWLSRSVYSVDEWHSMIYGELKNSRPVFLGGCATDDGHAFVCDGYDGAGLYHINWGWDGGCDGYFKLEVLNPYGSGTGGSSTYGGFSMTQEAIIGIQAPTGEERSPLYLTAEFQSIEEEKVTVDYYNMNIYDGVFCYGLGILGGEGDITVLEANTAGVEVEYRDTFEISYDMSTMGLSEGTYKIVPISSETTAVAWTSSSASFVYIEAVVDSDGNITLIEHPTVGLEVVSFEFTGNMVVNQTQEVNVKVRNTEEEFNGNLHIFASATEDGGELAGMAGARIAEGETDEVTLYFTPEQTGTYYIWIASDEDGDDIIGDTAIVIIDAPVLPADLEVLSFKIVAGTTTTVTAEVKNNSTEDYLKPLMLVLRMGSLDTTELIILDYTTQYQTIPSGESLVFTFSFDGLEYGCQYVASLHYYSSFQSTTAEMLYYEGFQLNETDGIGEVSSKVTDDAPYYTLSGIRVDNPRSKGVYIHNGKKVLVR